MQRISHGMTWFGKTVHPMILGCVALGTWLIPFTSPDDPQLWAVPIVFTTILPFYMWYMWPLKAVFLWEDSLLIKGLNKSITIPLSQVKSLEPYGLINQVRRCLVLREPCGFGSKIVFIPRYNYFFFPDKRMLKDLKSRIKEAKGKAKWDEGC